MDSWDRFEALVATLAPAGLRPPATAADLDALEVPPDWRHLWARHDGQAADAKGVFDGWYFLPLRGIDSVEAESDDDWLVVAKDFGGGTWAIAKSGGPLIESLDGDTRLVARNFIDLLDQMADALEGKPAHPAAPREAVRRVVEAEPAPLRMPTPVAARAAPAAPLVPPVPAETEPDDVLTAVAAQGADGWTAEVHARPQHAGGLVEIDFHGERRAVRLPPALRDGMSGTFEGATPDGSRLRVHIVLGSRATPQEVR